MSTVPTIKKALRVGILSRVSTLYQVAEEGKYGSCQAQVDICRELIKERKSDGWVEVDVYMDEGVSSMASSRPEYVRMQKDVRRGNLDVIVAYSGDRLHRNVREAKNFEAFLLANGVLFHTRKEGATKYSASETFARTVLQGANEYQRSDTIEKVQDKLRMKAMRGEWKGGFTSLGYSYSTETKLLTVNPDEAVIVRRIFEEVAKGVTPYDLSRKFKEEQILGRPSRYQGRNSEIELVERSCRPLSTANIRTIVENPIYRGMLRVANPEKRTSENPASLPDKIELPGKHEAIVDEALWHMANQRLAAPKVHGTRLTEKDRHGYILKNLLYCGVCGYAMTPTYSGKIRPDGRPYRFYKCVRTTKEGAECGCTVGAVPADAMESAIIGYTREMIKRPDLIFATLEASATALRPELDMAEERLKVVSAEHAGISEQSKRCLDAIKSGQGVTELITEEWKKLNEHRTDLDLERARLTERIKALRLSQPTSKDVAESLQKFDEMITLIPVERRKELMRLIFERIVVTRPTASLAWINATRDGAKPRMFRVELRLTTDWTAEDMEATTFGAAKPKANARLKFTVEFPYNSKKGVSAKILESDLVIDLNKEAETVEPVDATVAKENVVMRAKRWSEALANDETLTSTALAAKEGVSPATLSLHKKVLKLEPTIVKVLERCKDETTLEYFSLRRLLSLTGKTGDEQREFYRDATRHITRLRSEKAASHRRS